MKRVASLIVAAMLLVALAACSPPPTNTVQGYVEGEFVYVASPLAGKLLTLSVARGDHVAVGDGLFSLDNTLEIAAREEAQRRLAQSVALLEDYTKGQRPSEIDAAQARLEQARIAAQYAQAEYLRMQQLVQSKAISIDDYGSKQAEAGQLAQRVTELEAALKTAKLGQREDQISAAKADVQARQAMLAQAEWNLSQKHQDSPRAGVVFDTLYRPGEWVAAGRPIVSLLPPENIKARAFVPQHKISALHLGDALTVHVDGNPSPLAGKISFISPQSEYTPPVIYSEHSRDKLVYMIELTFDAPTAALLHPGQPVDVLLPTIAEPTP